MKWILVAFAAILATSHGEKPLTKDLAEFVDLLPMGPINAIVYRYMQIDEFLEAIVYIYYNEEFKQIVIDIEELAEFKELWIYMEESGLDVLEYLKQLHDAIGIPPPTPPMNVRRRRDTPRNIVNQCRDEVRAFLPRDAIKELHEYKKLNSPYFRFFAERMTNGELDRLLTNLRANEVFQVSTETLERNGIDIGDNMVFYAELFGFIY